jgi:hypothetical protein
MREPNLCVEKEKLKDWIRTKSILGKIKIKD